MEQGDGSKIPVVKIKQLKREPALEYMYKTGKREEELGTGLCADAEWWYPWENGNTEGQLTQPECSNEWRAH